MERTETSASLRILVADDNQDAAETLAMLLEMAQHTVTVVFDGRQAVDAARAQSFDVVILDLSMPHLDGYEAGRQIKACRADVCLIALSGHVQPHHHRRTSQAGFDHHVAKPLDVAFLMDVLQDVASRRAPTRTVALQPGALVQLREGGPVMSLQSLSAGVAQCHWFDECRFRHGMFLADRLLPADHFRRDWVDGTQSSQPLPLDQ